MIGLGALGFVSVGTTPETVPPLRQAVTQPIFAGS